MGVWLGHNRQSNEHLIGTVHGAVRAYSIRRMVEGRLWGADAIKNIKGTPQSPDPNMPGDHVPIKIRFDPRDDDERPAPTQGPQETVRRFRINASMLNKYGYTEGCEGCRYKSAGMTETRNHAETCRQRIQGELSKTPEGQRILDRMNDRVESKVALELERKG